MGSSSNMEEEDDESETPKAYVDQPYRIKRKPETSINIEDFVDPDLSERK